MCMYMYMISIHRIDSIMPVLRSSGLYPVYVIRWCWIMDCFAMLHWHCVDKRWWSEIHVSIGWTSQCSMALCTWHSIITKTSISLSVMCVSRSLKEIWHWLSQPLLRANTININAIQNSIIWTEFNKWISLCTRRVLRLYTHDNTVMYVETLLFSINPYRPLHFDWRNMYLPGTISHVQCSCRRSLPQTRRFGSLGYQGKLLLNRQAPTY